MSLLVQLSELKTRAREKSDMQNSGFVSDNELVRYINTSIQELYDLLIMSFGNDYYASETPYEFTTNQANDPVSLPSDFYKLLGVDAKISGSDFITLKPFTFAERNKYTGPYYWGVDGSSNLKYRIFGDQMRFTPNSSGGINIQVWYIPVASQLVLDTDTLDGINGYEELVIVDTAIKMLNKEESDVSVLMARKQELLRRITNAAENRDIGMSHRVSDVRNLNNYYDGHNF